MDTIDLPNMYVCLKPEGCGHTYQANHVTATATGVSLSVYKR